MNVSVILAHPTPDSFNHAIASTAVSTVKARRHDVWFHDLYAEDFDPVITSTAQQRQQWLREVEGAVAQYCQGCSAA